MISASAGRPVTKSQLAYETIKARILDGSYGPGYRLVLDQIGRELDVSAVPVREALRRLEAEELIQFERNVGARVTAIDPVAYQHAMQTVAIVEGAATGLAAPLLTPDELARARTLNDRMRRSLAEFDPLAFTALNAEFHEVLFGACPNPNLVDLVQRCWTRLAAVRDSTFSSVPGRAPKSVEEHDRLLALIEGGAAPDEVERFAREHRLATLEAYLARTR
ncbi:DNA-binding GntR family transcriptional regulator [Amycolatopsis lexingtonensis]|uniref:DNA-binding GntR family transcriptional regulator n=1 Tax=Amycolatopsis lexingtonensis TaxID=218822 RepID=A0ABR9HZV0_9PSEU|nr:GntR family transcriptional regulator [Amycolatopsis lexingtonensis]MBE1496443.1 DNA-binding GntR family transcriptional regulator [Amycolatopsis lexingtonensis]